MNNPNNENPKPGARRSYLFSARSKSGNDRTLGGARRVAKTAQDGKGSDRGEVDHVPSYSTRTESRPLPRKRSAGEMTRSAPVQEQRKSSILDYTLSESPRDGRERKRSSVSSAKSSLSGDDLHSSMTEKRHSDVAVPVNLQDRIVVNGKSYIKLKQIGAGGSCKVYRVLDESNAILALKCVDLSNVSSSQYNDYVNEVKLLETLRGSPGIIHMIDYDLQKENRILYIVRSFHLVFPS